MLLLFVFHMQYGYLPLHFASQDGHVECVNILIAHGSDVNAKDDVCFYSNYFICRVANRLSTVHQGMVMLNVLTF